MEEEQVHGEERRESEKEASSGGGEKTPTAGEVSLEEGGGDEVWEQSTDWEKCARQLTLNSRGTLENFLEVAAKILRNIINNPSEEKFRTLKLGNKAIQSKILSVRGGMDFFLACGFQRESTIAGEKVITIGADFCLTAELEQCVEWLRFVDVRHV